MSTAALLGGVFIGVLSALPIINVGNCCCLWIVAGGALAAYIAQQNTSRPLPLGRGAVVGLLAGFIGAFVWLATFAAVDLALGPIQQRMVATILQRSTDMPADVRDMLERVAETASSPIRYVLGFVFQLFVGSVFASLGGLVGAVMFRPNTSTGTSGDAIVPPPTDAA